MTTTRHPIPTRPVGPPPLPDGVIRGLAWAAVIELAAIVLVVLAVRALW